MNNVGIAISEDFFSAFARLPKKIQAKVSSFLTRFRTDPRAPGIHYEKLRFIDKNLYSVRIDREYRGIVHRSEKSGTYLLLWVDHHDRAYEWAKKKVVKIHPETGAIQVLPVAEEKERQGSDEPGENRTAAHGKMGLFHHYRDRQLLRLGVPEDQLCLVREIRDERDLDKREHLFPQEASEALYMLASGYSYEEALRELQRAEEEKARGVIDTTDFLSALSNPDSMRRFMVVEDDAELQAMLTAPLEKWRVFLHPTQRYLVERDWNGPVRVLGGAGTGKTVVAIHRAKWLAERITAHGDKVLFTTFTRNLAADIEKHLEKICTKEVMDRIEVINLDRWAVEFLRQQGYEFDIDYGQRTSELWEQAMNLAPGDLGLPEAFYRQEWEKVILPQEIDTLEQYLKASRIGRGTRLNRRQRKAVWAVFQEYRALLHENRLKEPEEAMRDARIILKTKGDILPYRSIVVDEAQDMSVQAFRLIRQMVPEEKNDIFIVGDAHQRIYRHKVVLGRCGINIRGRGRRLRVNYRTTEENRRWAVAILKDVEVDDLDGGMDEQRGYRSLVHGISPTVKGFETFEQEADFIASVLKGLEEEDRELLKDVCLVARTKRLLDQYQSFMEEKAIEIYRIRRSKAEDRQALGVRMATMHRVKGLEFERIIIAGANNGILPLSNAVNAASHDLAEKKEAEQRERALLYVAATRAKKEVLVTWFGRKSKYL